VSPLDELVLLPSKSSRLDSVEADIITCFGVFSKDGKETASGGGSGCCGSCGGSGTSAISESEGGLGASLSSTQ